MNNKWIMAARLASFFPARLARVADAQAPILQPSIIYMQTGSSSNPWLAINSTILTVTEELWITVVTTVPRSTARNGLVRDAKRCTMAGAPRSPAMAPDIPDNPINSTPNPRTISPIFLIILFFTNITAMTPPNKNTGAISDKLKDTS